MWIRGGGTVKQQGVIINLENKNNLKQANEFFLLLLNRALQNASGVALKVLFLFLASNLAFNNPILSLRRSDNIGPVITGLKAQSPCRSWSTKTTTVHQSVQGIISVNQWVSEYVSESLSWQLVLEVKRYIKAKLRLLWRNSPFQNVDSSSCWPWGPRNWLQFKNCQAPNYLGDLASPSCNKLQDSPSLSCPTTRVAWSALEEGMQALPAPDTPIICNRPAETFPPQAALLPE